MRHLGLDVYGEEVDLFFEDWTGQVLQDDVFASNENGCAGTVAGTSWCLRRSPAGRLHAHERAQQC